MAGNTYTWFGGSGSGDVPGNWMPAGAPSTGDTGIENAGTIQITAPEFTDNTLLENAGTLQSFNTSASVGAASFDASTSLIAGASGNAEFDVFGGFLNNGTIEADGHTLTVAVNAFSDGGPALAGTLLNAGLITAQNGATLDVTGGAGDTFQGGAVDLEGSNAVIAAADPNSTYTLDNTSTLALESAGTNVSVNFSGTADLLALNSTALDSTIDIRGVVRGDTLDIGLHDIGTIVYEPAGGSGLGGTGTPILTIIGTNGGTVLSDPFTNPYGNFVGNTSGTFVATTLASGLLAAGPFDIATASNGDTLLEALPPSTWTWTGIDPGNLNDRMNFRLTSGPGNTSEIENNGTIYGGPNGGDTVIANDATLAFQLNSNLSGNTLYMTGTSEVSFVGDQVVGNSGTSGNNPGISYQNPTLDRTSVISNDPLPPSTTTLNFAGYNVNDGTLISNGGPGSSLTIDVTQNGTAPGYLINYGDIEADTGNTVTIAVVGTSELFNAGLIYANGGTLKIEGSSSGIAGGYAPDLGEVALVGDGGTLEVNAGFPSGTEGSAPTYAFYDGVSGDTLKIDQLAQFSGRILGFQQGDTIDLGEALNVGSIVVTADGRLLLEGRNGSVLATLVLSSGAYNTGTFAVTAASPGTLVADGFTLAAGSDGNALLTTDVVNSVWNNASGTWQTAADWSTGVVPGPTATAVIGVNASGGADGTTSPFVVTTGSTAINVDSLIETNSNATLQITSATTIGTSTNAYALQQIAGEIEITGGNTLTAPDFKQTSTVTNLQIEPGAVLALIGHTNLGFANDGTISLVTVVNGTAFANGNTVGLFVSGTATVDGGKIEDGPVLSGTNVVSTGGDLVIGQTGGGTPSGMTVENGATVVDTYGEIASDPTSFGTLTLTGAGTTWDDASDTTDTLNTRGYMLVGNDDQSDNQPSPAPAGTAQLVVENDATLNEATYAEIANSADSAGSATIASGGVWNIGTSSEGGFLSVGNRGSGTLDIDGGTVNVLPGSTTASGGFPAAGGFTSDGTTTTDNAGMGIAHHVGSDGTLFVSDGGQLNVASAATDGSGFGVGQNGHGVLDIFDQGTVAITNGGISAGPTLGGDGTIIVGSGDGQSALLSSVGGTLSSGMAIGRSGTGTLYVNTGGTVQVSGGGISAGTSAGAYGFIEVNGGLLEDTTNGLTVGLGGAGTVDLVNSGTILTEGAGFSVGLSAGAQGLLEIASGGMLTSTTNGMNIGQDTGSTGTLEVLAGGIYNISTHGISDGLDAGATGTILVDGAGALINIGTETGSYGLDVGQGGTGYLIVDNNGIVSDSGAGISVGFDAGSTGTVVVGGGGRLITTGGVGINVGNQGEGLLNINAGGTVVASNYFDIASNGTSSSGTVAVSGGTLYDNGFLSVGGAGSGTLLVGIHALVDQTGLNLTIGASSGGTGIVDVNNATLDTQGSLAVGGAGVGNLSVSGAGVVNDGTGVVGIGAQSTGSGTVDVSAGTLLAGGMEVGGFGTGSLTVGNEGQVVIDGGTTNGIQIGDSVLGFGSGVVDINNGTISETGLGVVVGGVDENGFLQIDADGELITTGTSASGIPPILPTAAEIGATGFGNAAINVLGGTWIANGQIIVGVIGNGALDIAAGGLVNAGTNTVSIGSGSGTVGTITVGTGTVGTGTLLAGSLQIAESFSGTAGSGLVTIATGGTVDTGSLGEGSGGAVTVSGSLGVTGSSGISIGQSGNGPSALTVNSGGTVSDAGFLTVGSGGPGSLEVLGGVVNLTGGGSFVAGLNPAGAGVVTVDGGILNAGTSNLTLGNVSGSTGALTVENGATLSSGAVTDGNTGDGTATVTGRGSRFTEAGDMMVGGFSGGAGSLLVENDATMITGGSSDFTGFDVGAQTNASGVATVSGTGSLLDNTGGFVVGDSGLGNLSIESGATVTTTPGTVQPQYEAVIANQSGSDGSSVNVVGAGWQVNGALVVGNAGQGSLNITSGGTVSASTIDIASQANSAGDLSISGDNSSLVVTGSLAVGDLGSGDFSVLGSANAFIGGDLDFGEGSGSSGVIDLETSGTVTVNGALNFGAGGPGVLTLGPNTDLALSQNSGINGGPGGQLNLFTTIDPAPYSDNSTDNISGAFHPLQTQDYPAYVAATAFNLSHGVTYTLDTPVVYAASSFGIAGSGDSTANTLILNADSLSSDSSITFNNARGTLVIGSDQLGTIDVPASGTGPFTTEQNPNLGRLLLGDFDGTIGGFQSGDQIRVDTGLASASDGTLSQNGALVSVVDVANGDTLGVLTFVSSTQASAAIGDGAITLVPCFAAGTRIATARGEVAVEAIGVGERVRVLLGGGAAGDGLAEVVWVGRREVDCASHATPRKVWPVRVAADAFGPGRPHSELWLSPDHAVFVEDVLIPVRCLINGSTITQVPVQRVVYHHVELEQHDVLLAEGLPAESFLDMRDGSNYANRPGPVRLYPDYSARMWEAFGCARLVVVGPELEAARALVAEMAAEQKAA